MTYSKKSLEKLYTHLKSQIVPLYNIQNDTLKTVELVDLHLFKEQKQLQLTFAAPSQLQIKDKKNATTVLKDDTYFAYFIVDYDHEHIVLLMHPTSNLISICGETKKKEWDELTWVLLKTFKEKVLILNSLIQNG